MRKELEQRIVERWPEWFEIYGDPRRTAMVRGFECGDGWLALLYTLCQRLEPLIAELNTTLEDERFEVLQVKQKMGSLRFYTSHHTPVIDRAIEDAQQESFRTCEHCGRTGMLRDSDGWFATLCDECLHARGNIAET